MCCLRWPACRSACARLRRGCHIFRSITLAIGNRGIRLLVPTPGYMARRFKNAIPSAKFDGGVLTGAAGLPGAQSVDACAGLPAEPDLTPREAARLSGISYWTVLREIERGRLRAYRRAGNKLAIRRDDYCAWAYGQPVEPKESRGTGKRRASSATENSGAR